MARAGQFKKGNPGGPGRGKGTPNKLTQSIRDAIKQAFDEAGGKDYLLRLADEEPAVFIGLVKAIVPKEIRAEVDTLTRVQINVLGLPPPMGEKVISARRQPAAIRDQAVSVQREDGDGDV